MFRNVRKLIILGALALPVWAIPAQDGAPTGDEPAAESPNQRWGVANQALTINGLLRNDAIVVKTSNPEDYGFYNILENRLIFESKRQDWKYYADARLYMYEGLAADLYGPYKADVMRAFVRYFSPGLGDFTVGKTYVSFGNAGVFNPFEFDKSVQFSDLNYARAGLLAAEHYLPWQDTNGVKTYVGTQDSNEVMYGISPTVHLGTFEIGAVYNHTGPEKNIAGAFFKGDIFAGVQGSWAAHFDSVYNYTYAEGSGGLDYSFFDGDVIAAVLYYYNGMGAQNINDYVISADSYLLARHYLFSSLTWIIDEFSTLQFAAFVNLVDSSSVLIPSYTIILTGGLSVTAQMSFFTANKNEEFSKTRAGDLAALLRVEGKF